ncbi:MAG: AsmA-like C-terminal region-containing protein [Cyanobacteria bacterium P01_H01_bin.74]
MARRLFPRSNRLSQVAKFLGLLVGGATAGLVLIWAVLMPLLEAELNQSLSKTVKVIAGVELQIKKIAIVPTIFHGLRVEIKDALFSASQDKAENPEVSAGQGKAKNPDHQALLATVKRAYVSFRYLPLLLDRQPEIADIQLAQVSIPKTAPPIGLALKINLPPSQPDAFLKPPILKNTQVLLKNSRVGNINTQLQGFINTMPRQLGSRMPANTDEDSLTIQRLHIAHLSTVAASEKTTLSVKLALNSESAESPQKTPTVSVQSQFNAGLFSQPQKTARSEQQNLQYLPERIALSIENTDQLPLILLLTQQQSGLKKETNEPAYQLSVSSPGINLAALQRVYQHVNARMVALGQPAFPEWPPVNLAGQLKFDHRIALVFTDDQVQCTDWQGKTELRHVLVQASELAASQKQNQTGTPVHRQRNLWVSDAQADITIAGKKLILSNAKGNAGQSIPFSASGQGQLDYTSGIALQSGQFTLTTPELSGQQLAMAINPFIAQSGVALLVNRSTAERQTRNGGTARLQAKLTQVAASRLPEVSAQIDFSELALHSEPLKPAEPSLPQTFQGSGQILFSAKPAQPDFFQYTAAANLNGLQFFSPRQSVAIADGQSHLTLSGRYNPKTGVLNTTEAFTGKLTASGRIYSGYLSAGSPPQKKLPDQLSPNHFPGNHPDDLPDNLPDNSSAKLKKSDPLKKSIQPHSVSPVLPKAFITSGKPEKFSVVLALSPQKIDIQDFQATLAGSLLSAHGHVLPNIQQPAKSQYSLTVKTQPIELTELKSLLLAQQPNTTALKKQLPELSGQAMLALTLNKSASSNNAVAVTGEARLSNVKAQFPDSHLPISAPLLAFQFKNNAVALAETPIKAGPLQFVVSGKGQSSKQYNVAFHSGDIPLDLIRREQPLIRQLTGLDFPEIWNTAGTLQVDGHVLPSETQTDITFNNAGLSWRGGNLPVSNIRGKLQIDQPAALNGKPQPPRLTMKALTLRYGDSPINITATQNQTLTAEATGVLSPLVVNHFLVSHQTTAKPYAAIPFFADVSGALNHKNPADNTLKTTMAFDLTEVFQAASRLPWNVQKKNVQHNNAQKDSIQKNNSLKITNEKITTPKKTTLNAEQTTDSASQPLGIKKRIFPKIQPVFLSNKKQPSPQTQLARKPTETQDTTHSFFKDKSFLFESNMNNDNAAFARIVAHWQTGNLAIDSASLNLFDSGRIQLNGSIDNALDDQQRIYLLQARTAPEIDLAQLASHVPDNRFFKNAAGSISLNGIYAFDTLGDKLANGSIRFSNISLPDLTLNKLNGTITFQDETATITVPEIEIPGVSATFSGTADNIFQVPTLLRDVQLGGDFLSIDSLSRFNQQVVHPILVDELAYSFLRPWQQGDPTSSLTFRDGQLHFKEAVYQNILLGNLKSRFSLFANSFFELADTKANAANGEVSGYLSMSPNENQFTTLELNVNHVRVNALTQALLNVSNQIFGDMDGSVRFTTYGNSDVAMQKNANGLVNIAITNGRLPAIARIETVLATANIFRGGILGFNLNNLFRTLKFYDTNYFAELTGDMQIHDQVLYTDNLLSDGKNLDLLMQGSVRMDNGYADLVVNGQMRQNVRGKMGFLGRLSIGKLVNLVPVLGHFGENRSGVLQFVPGVGYFPGLGGTGKADFNKFQVRLTGDMNSANAIKGFRWVD